MESLFKIDRSIYSCITKDIVTDEVVLLDKNIAHIKDHHPGDYEKYCKYIREMLEEPDYIIEANRNPDKSGLVLKEFDVDEKRFRLLLRLQTSQDEEGFKNSIITFQYIHAREYRRLWQNKKVLYKRPGL